MKNISLILSVLAFIGMLVLSVNHFSSNKKQAPFAAAPVTDGPAVALRLAYMNIDSFEAHYEYLKKQKAAFDKKQEAMSVELERSARQLQNNFEEFQRKAQSGTITQSEGEAMEKKLIQMQQSLQLREQSLTEQLLREREAFNNQLHQDLNDYLEQYNRDKGFDYIFSYAHIGSPILLANKAYDITGDVIEGMNRRTAVQKDTTGKK